MIIQSCNDKRLHSLTRQIPLWTLWRIWKSRNYLIYQHKSRDWRKDAQQAITDAYEWSEQGNNPYTHARARSTTTDHGWKAPKHGYHKCNYDCSYNQQSTKVRAGWIMRDSGGFYKEATQSKGH